MGFARIQVVNGGEIDVYGRARPRD